VRGMASAVRISCSSDERYAPHCAAMLHSVLATTPPPVSIHYLHGRALSFRSRDRLARMVARGGGEIAFHEIPDSEVAELPTRRVADPSMWYRIFLPELLPEVDRVLHLDSDLIATDTLRPLWETDLAGSYLAAVTNVFERQHWEHPALLGMPQEAYFNSGVTLMNLELMRRDEITAALREYGLRHPESCLWFDQDALNVVLSRRRKALHPRWNVMNSFWLFPWATDVFGAEALAKAQREPAIRHFEGPGANKPWHLLCEHPHRHVYGPHRRRTPWPLYRPEGLTPRNLLRRLRP
jgi:lipopolysaccharide biosynthesis glycosyltransferase